MNVRMPFLSRLCSNSGAWQFCYYLMIQLENPDHFLTLTWISKQTPYIYNGHRIYFGLARINPYCSFSSCMGTTLIRTTIISTSTAAPGNSHLPAIESRGGEIQKQQPYGGKTIYPRSFCHWTGTVISERGKWRSEVERWRRISFANWNLVSSLVGSSSYPTRANYTEPLRCFNFFWIYSQQYVRERIARGKK